MKTGNRGRSNTHQAEGIWAPINRIDANHRDKLETILSNKTKTKQQNPILKKGLVKYERHCGSCVKHLSNETVSLFEEEIRVCLLYCIVMLCLS